MNFGDLFHCGKQMITISSPFRNFNPYPANVENMVSS